MHVVDERRRSQILQADDRCNQRHMYCLCQNPRNNKDAKDDHDQFIGQMCPCDVIGGWVQTFAGCCTRQSIPGRDTCLGAKNGPNSIQEALGDATLSAVLV
jgi:hypothetical protein